jgi:hypothetical protein
MVSNFVRHLITQSVSRNFSLSLRTALRWGAGVYGNFSANCSRTKSVYLLPARKTYSIRKTRSSIERTIVSKNWIKKLHTLPVLHFNRCLTTEYSETTAHFNGNFDTDNQIAFPRQLRLRERVWMLNWYLLYLYFYYYPRCLRHLPKYIIENKMGKVVFSVTLLFSFLVLYIIVRYWNV